MCVGPAGGAGDFTRGAAGGGDGPGSASCGVTLGHMYHGAPHRRPPGVALLGRPELCCCLQFSGNYKKPRDRRPFVFQADTALPFLAPASAAKTGRFASRVPRQSRAALATDGGDAVKKQSQASGALSCLALGPPRRPGLGACAPAAHPQRWASPQTGEGPGGTERGPWPCVHVGHSPPPSWPPPRLRPRLPPQVRRARLCCGAAGELTWRVPKHCSAPPPWSMALRGPLEAQGTGPRPGEAPQEPGAGARGEVVAGARTPRQGPPRTGFFLFELFGFR